MKRHRFKHFLRERNQFSKTGEETLLSVSEYYGVKPRAEAFSEDQFESRSETLEGYRIVRRGDLVMNYMLAWKGAYGLSEHNGITSPAYAVFDVDDTKVDRRFLHHRTRSKDMQIEFRSRSRGIIESRLRLYPDSLLAMEVNLPDLPTQKRIAAFLDRETARIDALIAKKERLVEVLRDRNALSRQTDLMKLRDDHGEWKLSHICQIERGRFNFRPRNSPQLYDGDHPFLQTGDVAQARKYITTYKQTLTELGTSVSKRFTAGTVLMAIAANVGDVAILNFDAYCPDSVVGFTPQKIIDHEFLYYTLGAASAEIARSSTSNAQDNSNIARLGALRVPLPPREVQTRIATAFAHQDELEIEISEHIKNSITRLREYRAALITAAVTGQIDVDSYTRSGAASAKLDQIEEEMQG